MIAFLLTWLWAVAANEGVLHENEPCYKACGRQAGRCDWCGDGGACCRLGADDGAAECEGHGGRGSYQCVKIDSTAKKSGGGKDKGKEKKKDQGKNKDKKDKGKGKKDGGQGKKGKDKGKKDKNKDKGKDKKGKDWATAADFSDPACGYPLKKIVFEHGDEFMWGPKKQTPCECQEYCHEFPAWYVDAKKGHCVCVEDAMEGGKLQITKVGKVQPGKRPQFVASHGKKGYI